MKLLAYGETVLAGGRYDRKSMRDKAIKITAKSVRYGFLAGKKLTKGVVGFVVDVKKEVNK